jgi:hypothetical protein
MSAFIVSQETMHAVVQSHEKPPGPSTALGQQLFAMNARAIKQRYGDDEDVSGYEYKPQRVYTPIERLKACRCLLYQCTEGDVPHEPLYLALAAHADKLASRIVATVPKSPFQAGREPMDIICDLPEYLAAPWDF